VAFGKRIVKGATYKVGVLGNPFNYNEEKRLPEVLK
jgi:hypothetical protein